MSEPSSSGIRKRQVYYVHGFDARGARFYHPLYRDEAAAQSEVCGVPVVVSDAQASGELAVSWDVRASCPQGEVQTRYTFLRWEDLVRAYWLVSRVTVIRLALVFYWHYIRTGAMRKLWACSKRYAGSVLAPLVMGVLAALGALAIAASANTLIGHMAPARHEPALWPGVLAGSLLLWGTVVWLDRSRLLWLARAWIFVHQWGHRNDEAIAARWKAFALHIASDADATDADEILLVGHSAGTWAVISILAEVLALPQGRSLLPKLRLMTLGQVVPMMSFCKHAQPFREQVKTVVASAVPWLDVTAPSDPLCTALASPLDGSGAEMPVFAVPWLVVWSARFDTMFEPVKFKRLAADPFRIHFQYLMATDLPVKYDYFAITAGHRPLSDWMTPPR